jgi:UDP-N-acetylenolpyruvoylglucosamine reductase
VFDWKSKDKKQDAYSVKQFGDELNSVNKATSREKASIVQVAFDDQFMTPNEVKQKQEKKRAIKKQDTGPFESGFGSVFDNLATYKPENNSGGGAGSG